MKYNILYKPSTKSTKSTKISNQKKAKKHFGKVLGCLKTWKYPIFLLYFCKSILKVC